MLEKLTDVSVRRTKAAERTRRLFDGEARAVERAGADFQRSQNVANFCSFRLRESLRLPLYLVRVSVARYKNERTASLNP